MNVRAGQRRQVLSAAASMAAEELPHRTVVTPEMESSRWVQRLRIALLRHQIGPQGELRPCCRSDVSFQLGIFTRPLLRNTVAADVVLSVGRGRGAGVKGRSGLFQYVNPTAWFHACSADGVRRRGARVAQAESTWVEESIPQRCAR
jgi:hypothetical protein